MGDSIERLICQGKDRLLRIDQLALLLNMSKRDAYRKIQQGHFKVLKFEGGKSLRILESSVMDYISRCFNFFESEIRESVPGVPGDDDRI